jgi:hypothetical protein
MSKWMDTVSMVHIKIYGFTKLLSFYLLTKFITHMVQITLANRNERKRLSSSHASNKRYLNFT